VNDGSARPMTRAVPAARATDPTTVHAHRLAVAGGKVAQDFDQIDEFQRYIAWRLASEQPKPWRPEIAALRRTLDREAFVRMYAERMLGEVAPERRHFTTLDAMLDAINFVTHTAPIFRNVQSISWQFPLSALMNFWMMTPSGKALMRLPQFNDHINDIMAAWCGFLNSPDSLYVLNEGPDGWLCPEACAYNALDDYEIPDRTAPHWGWTSYNDFFHRRVKKDRRPVDAPGHNGVINSPNDGVAWAVEHYVRRSDAFWLKNQVYSLENLLANDEAMVRRFEGGTVYQTYVNGGADWHGFSAPIDGRVVKAEKIRGYAWTESDVTPPDPMSGPYSQGWAAGVATRGLIYIDSGDPVLGLVCVVPIGLTEVSSLDCFVKAGDVVRKGDDLGWFSFGGSSFAMVFQPGAIREILVKPPLIGRNDQPVDTLRANRRCAIANLAQ
jgi:phosphatidylserine decarboxylase